MGCRQDMTEDGKIVVHFPLGTGTVEKSLIGDQAAADIANKKGTKDDKGKVKLTLLDPYFIEELARHMEKGMIKYERGNWQLDLEPERILNAVYRHANAITKNELIDPENGSNHSIALGANAMMLYFAERHGNIVKTEHDKK